MIAPIIALDPGPELSALVVWNGTAPSLLRYAGNEEIMALLRTWRATGSPCIIEKIASYGMAVGEEVFETVYWSGRFAEAYGVERVHRIPRLKVKQHLCHDSRAKDGNIRQALIDRFGKGTKKHPGPLLGVSGDLWAALAVAVTWWDTNCASGTPQSAERVATTQVRSDVNVAS
ncbi:MAG: hypothetical protein M3O20_05595 [Acidobacteriota bacterium]|nr:hypothetical protein [Acidobacteriota bacterium]